MPTVTTDPNKLEAQAKVHLGVTSFSYVAGGAGEKATMVRCLEDLQSGRIPQTLFLEKRFRILLIADRIPTASLLDNVRHIRGF